MEDAEFIYDPKNIGRADETDLDEDPGEDIGVEIYSWVDRIPLSELLGHLPTIAVVHLGGKLMRTLPLLHGPNILHRDIGPGSILLSEDGQRPVLIDFGLARLTDTKMTTALVSS